MITSKFITKRIDYSGAQLIGNWIEKNFAINSDAIVSFIGKCDVANEYMVDLEDLKNGETIYSEEMLHFIVEHFEVDMHKIVLRQRMLTVILMETLNNMLKEKSITRRGDDLFDADCKVTISIATTSPISSLIHFGINISSKNTPVKTKGLNDYGIDPKEFALEVMNAYKAEESSIDFAGKKVKLVDLA